jgi:hypothetical protein
VSLQASVVDGRVNVYHWDTNTLAWVAWDGSLEAGALTIGTVNQGTPGASAWKIEQTRVDLTPASGSVSSSGNNTLITPTAGMRLRVFYAAYNPSAAVEAAFRFGTSGTLFLRNNLTAGGSIVSKDFGEFRNITGGVDEPLILNLSSGVTTIWNCFYMEI